MKALHVFLFVLYVLLLVKDTKNWLPIGIVLHILLIEFYEGMALKMPGVGKVYFPELYLYVSFIILFFKMGTIKFTAIEKKVLIALLLLFLVYAVSLVFSYIKIGSGLKDVYRTSRAITVELMVFNVFLYNKLYGIKKIMSFLYYSSIFYIGRNFILKLIFGGGFHNAFFALIVCYILAYTYFFIATSPKASLGSKLFFSVVSAILLVIPFLGASRGGILQVIITFAIILIHIGKSKQAAFSNIVLIASVVAISYLLFLVVSPTMFRQHYGAQNMGELLDITISSTHTISARLTRWNIIWEAFKSNPFIGVGFTRQYLFDLESIFDSHNYFLSMLAGGGLLALSFVLNLYWQIFVQSTKRILRGNFHIGLLGVILVSNVLLINFTNTYFSSLKFGTVIWIIMGCGITLLFSDNFKSTINIVGENMDKYNYNIPVAEK